MRQRILQESAAGLESDPGLRFAPTGLRAQVQIYHTGAVRDSMAAVLCRRLPAGDAGLIQYPASGVRGLRETPAQGGMA